MQRDPRPADSEETSLRNAWLDDGTSAARCSEHLGCEMVNAILESHDSGVDAPVTILTTIRSSLHYLGPDPQRQIDFLAAVGFDAQKMEPFQKLGGIMHLTNNKGAA